MFGDIMEPAPRLAKIGVGDQPVGMEKTDPEVATHQTIAGGVSEPPQR